jgi:citryl-CoA lyase
MVQDLSFKTKISGHTQAGMEIRGHKLEELVDQADFVATVYLSITGQAPSTEQTKLLNAILVAAMDHGIEPASGFVPRVVASSGNDILTAMASSLLALGPYHGGAISSAMEVFEQIQKQKGSDLEATALSLIKNYRADKKRLPGFGHPVYQDVDPRTQQLFALARTLNLDLQYVDIALTLETLLEQETGRKLVLNIDGALAALLLTLNFPPKLGNGIFGLARVAGSMAHIVEEQESGKWVRRLSEGDVEYNPE